jgi:hypothetical protein
MSGSDPEFEEFLKRRRPLFRRDLDDGLEPPAELDRVVLRQAREAIEGDRPLRVFRTPRWTAPVAIAATLVLGLSIVFKAGVPEVDKVPEVTIENVAQRVDNPSTDTADYAATARSPAEVRTAPAAAATQGPVVVDLTSPIQNIPALASQANTGAPAAAPPAPALARGEVARGLRAGAPLETASAPTAAAAPVSAAAPAWRNDSKSWQAEIDRLRASGDHARANAELAEFNRQHRAYAVAPDR